MGTCISKIFFDEHRHEIELLRRNDGDVASHSLRCDDNSFTERRSVMQVLSRRDAIAFLAGVGVAARANVSAAAPSQSLGAIAAKNGFVFGAAAGPVIDKDVA